MSGGTRRRLPRWVLPALIALPFVAAAVFDLARRVVAEPAPDLDLIQSSDLRFEPLDPVFDLRAPNPSGATAWTEPSILTTSGWAAVTPAGSRMAGNTATLEVEVGAGSHRVLFVEARGDRRAVPVIALSVRANGIDCGRAALAPGFEALRFTLPAGAVEPGRNVLELRILDSTDGRSAEGRAVVVRRIALSAEHEAAFAGLVATSALVVNRERGLVLVHRPGRLVAPFTTRTSGSLLRCRVRFRDPTAQSQCRVIVARRYAGPDRYDVVSDRTVIPSRKRGARIRQELRDRGERGALIVEVNREAAEGGLLLTELRVESRPKRARPRAE